MNYRVNNEEFAWFDEARKYAEKIGAEVFQISNGLRRWAPAAKPSDAKMRRYRNRLAAYEAQQAAK